MSGGCSPSSGGLAIGRPRAAVGAERGRDEQEMFLTFRGSPEEVGMRNQSPWFDFFLHDSRNFLALVLQGLITMSLRFCFKNKVFPLK